MIKVGLTGNIGSGKTTVCKIFEVLGIPVFYADEKAKSVLELPHVLKKVAGFLGEDVINAEGKPDKAVIASKVFADNKLLKKLNSIIHPEVIDAYYNWLKEHSGFSYTVKEAAILIESGYYKELDKIIFVESDENIMINRVAERDMVKPQQVKQRLDNQMSQKDKKRFADYIIKNFGDTPLIPQVVEIHKNLI